MLKKIKFVKEFYDLICEIRNSFMLSKLKRNGYICKLKGKKAFFYFPYIETDGIQNTIFYSQKYYENKYLDYLCDEWHGGIIGKVINHGTILDIGSNIGNHSIYFLLEREANFSYCFEPAKDTFMILNKNMEINQLNNRTKLYNAGVGRSSGKGSIAFSKEKDTAYTQVEMNENGDVKIVGIDELNIDKKITFVKVDVEGFELDVLYGMEETLKRDKPIMMIEIWKKNYNEVLTFMKSLGYTIETIIDDGGHNGDYVCYPL